MSLKQAFEENHLTDEKTLVFGKQIRYNRGNEARPLLQSLPRQDGKDEREL